MEPHIPPFWLRGALGQPAIAELDQLSEKVGRPGGRIDWTLAQNKTALQPVTDLISEVCLPHAKLVRVVWFTKDAATNWSVPWHQDRVIATAQRHDMTGFGNWTQKGGIWHCEPPVATFAQMRFVRVHLDDCDGENGAMQIAVGSESCGVVAEKDAARIAATFPIETCVARRGDIQILPMLVLHRSHAARNDRPRRALRLDYALQDLPLPMTWHAA